MAHHKKQTQPKPTSVKDVLRLRKKESKLKLKEKRARLVVKNLPFIVTEENLRDHFGKFGNVTEVTLLKKEDGKALGCAFIQFDVVQKARKAQFHTNGKPFYGRNLEVDFAKPKSQYEKILTESEIKQEPEVKQELPEVKIEKIDSDEEISQPVGETPEEMEESSEKTDDSSDESDSSVEDFEEVKKEEPAPHPKVISHDVNEGKTIFIKNVPFNATKEDLKNCMSQFGPMYYALICVDKFTEHSKGTAFVKFCSKKDAEKALQAGTELTLLGNILDCHRALDRSEIMSKQHEKTKKPEKDSRNLYLVEEGLIMAGSKAAEGVSASDMAKRLQLEQYKTQILKNLNMFISRERLVIHNLPTSWDDRKLKKLCAQYVEKDAKIKEARIMRDTKGVGKSKEFGFVTLDTHENALKLLRTLNNNPNIFSKTKRPIVSFSIEKRSAMKTKLKRMERSKMKNPKSKLFNQKLVDEDKKKFEKKQKISDENMEEFSGIPSKPGIKSMRSGYKLRVQAEKHHDNLKKEKRKLKIRKKSFNEKKQEFTKQEKQKIVKRKEGDDFSKLVSSYKKTISNAPQLKTKWYS